MTRVVLNTVKVTKIKDVISKLINTNFGNSLGLERDIVNVVAALIKRESSFNVNALGHPVSSRGSSGGSSGGYGYYYSSVIQSLFKSGTITPTQENNINKGFRGIGLMQVMGWNFVKKASRTGVCEIERIRPDLAPLLVVEAGEDMATPILGEDNIDKAILAGLILLEGKYRAVQPDAKGEGFSVRGDPYRRVFSSKLAGALAAYLGLGKADLNNTTPEAYALSILGGDAYVAANGTGTIKIYDTSINVASSNGPTTNGINQGKIGNPGCTKPATKQT